MQTIVLFCVSGTSDREEPSTAVLFQMSTSDATTLLPYVKYITGC